MSFEDFLDQESSGGIDKFTLTVTNAFFAIDPNYSEAVGADVYFLHWEGTTDVEGHETMTRDGFHPKWATDPDWMSIDGGKTVKSQSGKGRLGKAAGRMMTAAANAIVEAGLKDSPENPFNAPGASPQVAETWIGTTWFMEEVEREFGSGMKSRDLLPTKFIGTSDVSAAPAAPAAAPAPATSAAPATDLRAQVVAVANGAADHQSFMQAALAIPGVSSDSALVADIVNPSGIFATKS